MPPAPLLRGGPPSGLLSLSHVAGPRRGYPQGQCPRPSLREGTGSLHLGAREHGSERGRGGCPTHDTESPPVPSSSVGGRVEGQGRLRLRLPPESSEQERGCPTAGQLCSGDVTAGGMCPHPSPWEPRQAKLRLGMSSLPRARARWGPAWAQGSIGPPAAPASRAQEGLRLQEPGGQVAMETKPPASPEAWSSDREAALHRAPCPGSPAPTRPASRAHHRHGDG